MTEKRLFSSLLTLVLTLVLSSLAFGQTDRGVITGTVKDSSGAVVPEADVTATNLATNVTSRTKTTGDGIYTIPALPAGTYRVRIEKGGFKASEQADAKVVTGLTTNIDVDLETGQLSETIEITGESATLQTESAKVSSQVTNKMVEELPLVVSGAVRSPFDLALVTAESKQLGDDRGGGFGGFAIGGGQGGGWGVTLDGITAGTNRVGSVEWASVNAPSLDAITEFTVDSHGFKAEFGRAAGGIMSFTSKSGTNDLHGTLYEFVRNNAFDARRFFEARRGIYKQHDFGFSVGGPVMLPRFGEGGKNYYSGRNKTFFFVAAEFFRNRIGASSGVFSVPTPEMYNGDFSKWVDQNGNLIPIYDPATTRTVNGVTVRDPFPGNIIPQNRISPLAQAILAQAGVLEPNNGAAPGSGQYVRNNYINATGTRVEPWTKFSVKIDHNFTENNKVSFLYNFGEHLLSPGPDGFPGLPGVRQSSFRYDDQTSKVYRGNWTSIISPTVVNYFFAGVNKMRDNHRHPNTIGGWSGRGICIINAFDCDENFPIIEFSDFNTWGGAAADGSFNPSYSFGDDVTITRGKHTFKTGYLYERLHYEGFGRQTISGRVTFNRLSTSVPGIDNIAVGGGNSFASFLLGEIYASQTENRRIVQQQWRSHSMYFQDDWKVTPRLTLNLGVRYEFTLPPLEANDKWSDFTPDRPNPRAGGIPGALRFAGFGEGREGSRTLTPGWYGGIGPRLSAAYSFDDKTVVRAGIARTFGIVKTVFGSTHFQGAITIDARNSLDLGITRYANLDTGIPAPPIPPSTDPSFVNGGNPAWWQGNEVVRLPENYDWTLSVQRELGKGFVLETAYNATIGTHLTAGLLRYNQLDPAYLQQYGRDLLLKNINSPEAIAAGIQKPFPTFSGNVAQALRPFPQYNDIDTQGGIGDKSGHSTYHAGVAKLSKRIGDGVTLESSYVFSKLFSDADQVGGQGALNHYNRRLEKAVSTQDQTHIGKFNYIYELPFGKGKRWAREGIAAALLGDWRFAGVHLYASGTPLSFCSSASIPIFNGRCSLTVTTYEGWIADNDNADWKGNSRYFNAPSTFAAAVQPDNQLGTATRTNPLARTPANLNENFSLAKSIRFSESLRLDLRAEAFNAFNRVRFNPGDTNINSTNFGRVTSTLNEPRRMQFAAKFYF